MHRPALASTFHWKFWQKSSGISGWCRKPTLAEFVYVNAGGPTVKGTVQAELEPPTCCQLLNAPLLIASSQVSPALLRNRMSEVLLPK